MFEVWATYPLNLNVWIKLTQNLPSSKPFSSEVTVYKMLIEYEKLMAPVNSDFFFKITFFSPNHSEINQLHNSLKFPNFKITYCRATVWVILHLKNNHDKYIRELKKLNV